MKQFWQSLVDANNELNDFINSGMPLQTEKRHRSFVKRWDSLKEKSEALCEAIEEQPDQNVEPVEIILPWESEAFAEAWKEWKDYLAEQFNKRMKSRMERAALSYLKELCSDKEDVAMQYLRFAMANGYPRFFKVTEKNDEQANLSTAGGRGDGDF